MADSELRSLGHLRKLTFGGLRDSQILAAVAGDIDNLPDKADDFDAEARITGLRVVGLEDEPFSVMNTVIAAWTLDKISLVGVQNDNGGQPFGLVAHEIHRLTQPGLPDGVAPLGGGGPSNDSIVLLI